MKSCGFGDLFWDLGAGDVCASAGIAKTTASAAAVTMGLSMGYLANVNENAELPFRVPDRSRLFRTLRLYLSLGGGRGLGRLRLGLRHHRGKRAAAPQRRAQRRDLALQP